MTSMFAALEWLRTRTVLPGPEILRCSSAFIAREAFTARLISTDGRAPAVRRQQGTIEWFLHT
jgi:hypothetical protein